MVSVVFLYARFGDNTFVIELITDINYIILLLQIRPYRNFITIQIHSDKTHFKIISVLSLRGDVVADFMTYTLWF